MTTIEKIRIMEDIRKLSDSEWEEVKAKMLGSVMEDENVVSKNKIEKKVSEILKEIGIPASITGYEYIKRAVMISLENPKVVQRITKELYPRLAKEFGTPWYCAERCMRHAIEIAIQRGNMEKIDEIFGYTYSSEKGKPTNAQFIAGIVEYIQNN